jgi:hypothetical protein
LKVVYEPFGPRKSLAQGSRVIICPILPSLLGGPVRFNYCLQRIAILIPGNRNSIDRPN